MTDSGPGGGMVPGAGQDAGQDAAAPYCGHCGEPQAARDHVACRRHLELEPPRFCSRCRRRMKVQVTPGGWSAACAVHGLLSG